jgi:hypothetical protein
LKWAGKNLFEGAVSSRKYSGVTEHRRIEKDSIYYILILLYLVSTKTCYAIRIAHVVCQESVFAFRNIHVL